VRHDDGRLLVERAVATLRDGGCARIVVVLGAESARVRAEAQLGDARLVDNPTWKSGMGSSLRVGHAAVADGEPWPLLGCFHPSQQNTFTGKLTPDMLDAVLNQAKDLAWGA
jgi:uracil-DNA glycosylase